MTIRDKKIKEEVDKFISLVAKTGATFSQADELSNYFRNILSNTIIAKDEEIGDLKERLCLFQNTTALIKTYLDNLISSDHVHRVI